MLHGAVSCNVPFFILFSVFEFYFLILTAMLVDYLWKGYNNKIDYKDTNGTVLNYKYKNTSEVKEFISVTYARKIDGILRLTIIPR